jgi:2-hydroxychromene-2-carboxylate isomerase
VSAPTVRYFTDPACPPDPALERLRAEHTVELRMIVLREHRGPGWPNQPGSDATIHACRAVVGTRLRWPGREHAMLERLQALARDGELLDDSDTLELAAAQAGLPVAELAAYCGEPEVEAALRADMAAAAGRGCGETDQPLR